jgi:hypothetical protein
MSVARIIRRQGHMMVDRLSQQRRDRRLGARGEHQDYFEVFSERVSYPLA